jgi:hypothetical protein
MTTTEVSSTFPEQLNTVHTTYTRQQRNFFNTSNRFFEAFHSQSVCDFLAYLETRVEQNVFQNLLQHSTDFLAEKRQPVFANKKTRSQNTGTRGMHTYNVFVKEQTAALKETQPNLDNNARMAEIGRMWSERQFQQYVEANQDALKKAEPSLSDEELSQRLRSDWETSKSNKRSVKSTTQTAPEPQTAPELESASASESETNKGRRKGARKQRQPKTEVTQTTDAS